MRSLFSMLPDYYESSQEAKIIQAAFDAIMAQAWADRDDCANQLNVDSATWGLTLWEEALSIQPASLMSSLDARRSAIKSKLRGRSTSTKSLIESICLSYANGDVTVTEIPAEYKICIKFGEKGHPAAIDDLQTAIGEIIPAHLAIVFEFTFNTHRFLLENYHKYSGFTGMTYSEMRGDAT